MSRNIISIVLISIAASCPHNKTRFTMKKVFLTTITIMRSALIGFVMVGLILVSAISVPAQSVKRLTPSRSQVREQEQKAEQLERERLAREQFAKDLGAQEQAKKLKDVFAVRGWWVNENTPDGMQVISRSSILVLCYYHRSTSENRDYDHKAFEDMVAAEGEKLTSDKQFVAKLAEMKFVKIKFGWHPRDRIDDYVRALNDFQYSFPTPWWIDFYQIKAK